MECNEVLCSAVQCGSLHAVQFSTVHLLGPMDSELARTLEGRRGVTAPSFSSYKGGSFNSKTAKFTLLCKLGLLYLADIK